MGYEDVIEALVKVQNDVRGEASDLRICGPMGTGVMDVYSGKIMGLTMAIDTVRRMDGDKP